MGYARHLAFVFAVLALAACDGGGGGDREPARPLGSLSDSDPAVDAVSEAGRSGTAVGITVEAPELSARGAVAFTLPNSSNGSFGIGAATGVVTLAGSVDYESAASRTITVRATSADGQFYAERDFAIEVVDSPAPALEIGFPFAHANFAYATAGVSGRIIHPDPSSISVRASAGAASTNGVVHADGRFFVKDVAVTAGDALTLTVVASHAGNESATASLSLGRAPDLSIVEALIVDGARDRYLLADRYSGTIVAISRNGYVRSLVSGAGKGSGPALEEPVDLALDADNDRLYVVDNALDAVVRVDPRTGDRTTVSSGSIRTPGVGTGENLLDPTALVYDALRRRLLVADDGHNMLVAIDPSTGNRTTVSDNSDAYGPTLNFWGSLGLDAPRNRVITVSISVWEQYGVDLTTGVRTLVSDLSHDIPDANRGFTGISVATTRDVAYLADDFSNAVVRMELATGARTSVSSSGLAAGLLTHPVIGTGPELEWPTDVLYDELQDRLFVIEEGFADPLIEVDQATGNRTLLTNGAVGAGINFKDPAGIVLDPRAPLAYVVDNIADVVVAVNLDDGSRRLIAGSPTGRGTIATDPLAIELDAAAEELYVGDFTENSLYSLNVSTGARLTIADGVTGSGPLLDNPVDVAFDGAARGAYVLDARLDALLAVDLSSRNRRIVAGGFGRPVGLDLDPAGGWAYVSESGGDIFRVELATGQKALVASMDTGGLPRAGQLDDIALDPVHGRLIALDLYPNRVLAIDLATGSRSVLSGAVANGGADVGGGPSLEQPRNIDLDASRQIAFVTDNLYDAVIAVDLVSGYRQIVAR